MGFNVKGAVQIPLSVFGGLCTQVTPINLPPGCSPDLADMIFQPGSVLSRPGMAQVLGTSLGAVTVTYAKSFTDNSGIVRNLYFDSGGNLWIENVTASPGTRTLIGTSTPGSYARSITAFGREFIAISDGLHGADVPLQYDGTNLDLVTQDGPGTPPTVANLALPSVSLTSLTRAANVVTAVTGGAHGLKVGYQALIAKVLAQPIGGFITNIRIANEENPGIATVTTSMPHGLASGMTVGISNVDAVGLGNPLSQLYRYGQVVTVITSAPHNLSVGTFVTIADCPGDQTFKGSFAVNFIANSTQFTYIQAGADATVAGANLTTLIVSWPLPNTATPTLFEVIEAPTATTFQIPLAYSNGSWNNGLLTIAWNGSFFVDSVPSSTTFTYKSIGPSITTLGGVGTVTPNGQIAPGTHQMQVLFQTRNGYVTKPSPPVSFFANGGQYLSVTNIPVGPPNVVARILAFTGAEGAFFFYIPVPAVSNGEQISTSTQVGDNTSTSVVLDFSDQTLFSGLAISKAGNRLANQIVLDSALGFGLFGDRLITWGQRNTVDNLLNMGFDGGSIGLQITGWTGSGLLTLGHFSEGVGAPHLSQSFYRDAYGAPIALPNVKYRARAWMSLSGCVVTISSASSGFSTTATLVRGPGGWGEAAFTLPTQNLLPSDLKLTLTSSGIVDHLSISYDARPFLINAMLGSYVNNPEAFDGVSGEFGVEDTRQVMGAAVIRGLLYVLTQDPAGRLHSIQANATTEPVGWESNAVAEVSGALSSFGITISQANDATEGGGEEWMAWASVSGPRIFNGQEPYKIGQEIQPSWSGDADRGFPGINIGAYLTIWALNDPTSKRVYFGLPLGMDATAPNKIYHMDYKGLSSAYEIAEATPMSVGGRGIMGQRENARKWGPWNYQTNGAALMYREAGGPLVPVFFTGNGFFPGSVAGGTGNVCTLTGIQDDTGNFDPYYFTYAFTGEEIEQGLGLGGQRKLLQYLQWATKGQGTLKVTIYPNTMSNPWPITFTGPLRTDPTYDDEWGAGQASGQRFFLKFEAIPA